MLEQTGYVYTDPVHKGLRTTQKANMVLFHSQTITAKLRQEEVAQKKRKSSRIMQQPQEKTDLFDALRALRREIAAQEKIIMSKNRMCRGKSAPAVFMCSTIDMIDSGNGVLACQREKRFRIDGKLPPDTLLQDRRHPRWSCSPRCTTVRFCGR